MDILGRSCISIEYIIRHIDPFRFAPDDDRSTFDFMETRVKDYSSGMQPDWGSLSLSIWILIFFSLMKC